MKDIVQKIVSFGTVKLNHDNLPAPDVECMLLLPIMDMVMFPDVTMPIILSRETSLEVVKFAEQNNLPVCVVCQKAKDDIFPSTLSDLHETGVIADVIQIIELPDGRKATLVQSRRATRIRIKELNQPTTDFPGLTAKVDIISDPVPRSNDKSFAAIMSQIKEVTDRILNASADAPSEIKLNISHMDDPDQLVNFLCTQMPLELEKRVSLLRKNSLRERAKTLLKFLYENSEMLDIVSDIRSQAREAMSDNQRKAFLQHQYDVIRTELFGDENDDIEHLKQKADDANLPEDVYKLFERELKKLERLNPSSPDYSVLQSYLETVTDLPWSIASPINSDLSLAEKTLNEDHYGLDKIKQRVLEQIALSIRNPEHHAPILCLVGAPGIGKTSLGISVAKALGRKYQRVSLGGMHDEAEIRGHRRTYIGAMPGRVISAIKRAGVNNPVLLLDEIDKIGRDFKGDPEAALLEVMDPEQNNKFHDNYIDADFDLSNVFFIATANSLESLSRPLLDRMEIIEMHGYLPQEKLEIVRHHLLPKIRASHGLDIGEFDLTDQAIIKLIDCYTSESGVRQLEKRIAELARKTVYKIARNEKTVSLITPEQVLDLLGIEQYSHDSADLSLPAGVATGLAWTAVGGEILFIEASRSQSKSDKLTITGNIGNIMKESAMIALQYLKSHCADYNIDPELFESGEFHIHVPEGAIPKDGPSAGITMVTAIASLLTGRPVKPGTAMSGEITLRGKVLPVGGLKEKILAAKRSGITHIYLSSKNRKDVEDIPNQYIQGIDFSYVDDISQVLGCLS